MGKSTINMAIFNSYVSLPEGIPSHIYIYVYIYIVLSHISLGLQNKFSICKHKRSFQNIVPHLIVWKRGHRLYLSFEKSLVDGESDWLSMVRLVSKIAHLYKVGAPLNEIAKLGFT